LRRLLSTSALVGLFATGLIALPVAAEPVAAAPHPVPPSVRTLSAPAATVRFSTVGATWDRGALGHVEVRTRSAGQWTGWTALEAADYGPDSGTADAARGSGQVVSGPLWVGGSDAYQTRSVGGAVSGLQIVVVDPGTSAADADPTGTATGAGVARAAAAKPAVYTRGQWGADESLRSFNGSGCATPDYSSTVKVGFVHHTDGANDYTSAEVPAVIRGIYAYHVKTNGWCDIGYNFLVDRFGRVWEGRYGGVDRPVIGAHTGGHNQNSFGTSLLGTYTSVQPSPAMVTALQGLMAWKLAMHYADPNGTAQLTSAGGGTSRYPAGTTTTFDVISGHRDAGFTACPGNAAYAKLGGIRTQVGSLMGAGLVLPTASVRSSPYAGGSVTVTAGVLRAQTWRLDVSRAADGTIVRTFAGSTSAKVSQVFDLKDTAGAWLPPGGYELTLTSSAGAMDAVPWRQPFDITATSTSPPPARTGGPPAVASFTPLPPTRLLDTRSGLGSDLGAQAIPAKGRVDVQVLGVGGVPATGVAAVALNLTGIAHGGPTFLSSYPADSPWPGTSSLNLAKDQVHAALVMPRVGADGHVSVYNSAATSDAVIDVVGYFPTAGGSSYTPVAPARLVDTRTTRTPFRNGEIRTVHVAGKAGVPSNATAVVANVTVTGTTSAGLATVFPAATRRPVTSTLNFIRGEVATNRFVSGLSGGKLSVYTQVSRADVVVDVVGYFGSSAGTAFTPLTPTRILDTRRANGVPGNAAVPGGSTTVVPVAGRGGVPSDAAAVVMTLTTTDVTKNGFVTAWSGTGPRPVASDVNTWSGHTVANLVVVQLGRGPASGAGPGVGSVSLFNAGRSAHLVGDVLGYFR
jgi:hypothetical protein